MTAGRGAAAVPGRPAIQSPAVALDGEIALMVLRPRRSISCHGAALAHGGTASSEGAPSALGAAHHANYYGGFLPPAESFAFCVSPTGTETRAFRGRSSGIGAATARALAAPDTAIAPRARRSRAGADKGRPGRARQGAGRRSRQARHRASPVEETAAAFGQLDVVVSNAGFADRRAIGALHRARLGTRACRP